MPAHLVKRSFSLSGHRTSIALEPEFWAVLDRMAAAAGQTLAARIAAIDATRSPEQALTSRLRIAALDAALTFDKAIVSDPAAR